MADLRPEISTSPEGCPFKPKEVSQGSISGS